MSSQVRALYSAFRRGPKADCSKNYSLLPITVGSLTQYRRFPRPQTKCPFVSSLPMTMKSFVP
jgi:hypothetical protein